MSTEKPALCEACQGSGVLLSQRGKIERCDLCQEHKSDYDAWLASEPQ